MLLARLQGNRASGACTSLGRSLQGGMGMCYGDEKPTPGSCAWTVWELENQWGLCSVGLWAWTGLRREAVSQLRWLGRGFTFLCFFSTTASAAWTVPMHTGEVIQMPVSPGSPQTSSFLSPAGRLLASEPPRPWHPLPLPVPREHISGCTCCLAPVLSLHRRAAFADY